MLTIISAYRSSSISWASKNLSEAGKIVSNNYKQCAMAKLVVFFAVLTVYANGAVIPAVTKAQDSSIVQQINGLVLQVQTLANNVSTSLLNALPDNKEVTDSLITQIQQFSQNVIGVIGRIKSEVNRYQASFDSLLKATTTNLNNIIASLQNLVSRKNPIQIIDIRTQLGNGLKDATAEIQRLSQAVQPQLLEPGKTLQNFAKGIVNDFVKAVDNIRTQVNALPSIGRK